jgi:hypothetical protein
MNFSRNRRAPTSQPLYAPRGCSEEEQRIFAAAPTPKTDMEDRLIARGHCIPIIFITGYPDDTARARAMKAEAIDFSAEK